MREYTVARVCLILHPRIWARNQTNSYDTNYCKTIRNAKRHRFYGDVFLYFALLYPQQNFEDAIIIKGYSGSDPEVNQNSGEITIKLSHNETKHLIPGVYYYTTKLHIGCSLEDLGASIEPDEVRTIIERTKFIVNN